MIEVKGLRFSYTKETFIEDMSFVIQKGEIFGLLGPSGAGKSTIQKILTGNIRKYQGSVKVLNKEANTFDKDMYHQIGVQFEVPNLYSKYSALENLHFFGSLYHTEVLEASSLLSWVGLEKDGNKLVKDFSKGMKTRLNFIRAIAHQPKILFLDEPTSGLDPINAKIVKDKILELQKQGTTILLTTHNMHDVKELCDSVAFIDQGKILMIDDVEHLMTKSNDNPLTYVYQEGPKRIEVNTTIKDIDVLEVGRLFKEKKIISMHTKETTLNDWFIRLSGRELHDV